MRVYEVTTDYPGMRSGIYDRFTITAQNFNDAVKKASTPKRLSRKLRERIRDIKFVLALD